MGFIINKNKMIEEYTRPDESTLSKRDLVRLKKEPFITMVKPRSAETIDQLRGWTPPRGAYVLLENVVKHLSANADPRIGTSLISHNVDNRPDHQGWKLREYQRKGATVLHYGNFPKTNDPIEAKSAKAQLYSGPGKKNPWDALEQEVKEIMRANPGIQEELVTKSQEVDELKAKLAAMEKKIAKDKVNALVWDSPINSSAVSTVSKEL